MHKIIIVIILKGKGGMSVVEQLCKYKEIPVNIHMLMFE